MPYVYRTLITSNKYVGGVSLSGGVVSGIDKRVRTLKVTIYDNYNNKVLGERVFHLSPVVVHQYTTELHYTDINGNPQIYAGGTETWIPADTTISAKVVVKDEYGATVPIKKFRHSFSDSMGEILSTEGDEIPSTDWLMRNINLIVRKNRPLVITPEIAEPLKMCDYVKPLMVGNVNY